LRALNFLICHHDEHGEFITGGRWQRDNHAILTMADSFSGCAFAFCDDNCNARGERKPATSLAFPVAMRPAPWW
jgi:hypothetical protein